MVGCAAVLRHLLCSGEESPNGIAPFCPQLRAAFSTKANCMRPPLLYHTDLMRQKHDVTTAIMAMAPVHEARGHFNRSRASTAPQGCAVLMRAWKRGRFLGFGLDHPGTEASRWHPCLAAATGMATTYDSKGCVLCSPVGAVARG
jgi:hypothetical protein